MKKDTYLYGYQKFTALSVFANRGSLFRECLFLTVVISEHAKMWPLATFKDISFP